MQFEVGQQFKTATVTWTVVDCNQRSTQVEVTSHDGSQKPKRFWHANSELQFIIELARIRGTLIEETTMQEASHEGN